MTPTELATELMDLLDLDSDLVVDITPYDAAGTAYIIDIEPHKHGLLVQVTVYD